MIDESQPPQSPEPPDPSRRKFIIGAAAITTVGAAASVGFSEVNERFLQPRKELIADWESASVENEQFMEVHKTELEHVRLGCSLSPEQLEWLGIHDSPEQVLDYLQELGINNIRLGIRWDRSVDNDGNIDLSYYGPWIVESLKRGMDLCLNVGPIKVFRWPEDHVPKSVLKRLEQQRRLPEKGALIQPDDPLAREGLEYLNTLLPELAKLTQGHTVTIQPENEAQTPFGEHEWVASSDYLFTVVKTILDHFPNSPILLNSPAVKQSKSPIPHSSTLEYTAQLAKALVAARPGVEVISGVDVYPETPHSMTVPRSNGLQVDTQMALLASRGEHVLHDYVADMTTSGIRTEVTELQAEPWGNRTQPGNSAQSLRFAVLRSLPFVDTSKPTTLRLWGIEHLYAKLVKGKETEEHKKIDELVQMINAQA